MAVEADIRFLRYTVGFHSCAQYSVKPLNTISHGACNTNPGPNMANLADTPQQGRVLFLGGGGGVLFLPLPFPFKFFCTRNDNFLNAFFLHTLLRVKTHTLTLKYIIFK